METIEIVLTCGGLLTLGISIAAFLRQNKHDAAKLARKISTLEERVNNQQLTLSSISVTEIAKMQQTVATLNERVNKLDTDVENKIDKLSEKIDGIIDKMNQLLLTLAKNNNNV
jgi:uncharacterized protein YoxC